MTWASFALGSAAEATPRHLSAYRWLDCKYLSSRGSSGASQVRKSQPFSRPQVGPAECASSSSQLGTWLMLSPVLSALGKPAHPPTMATRSSVVGHGLAWFEHSS